MSRLEDISVQYRNDLITKNTYDNNDTYEVGHSNALSNGDDKGKGENGGDVGGITDIKTRNVLITKNKYKINKEYNSSTA